MGIETIVAAGAAAGSTGGGILSAVLGANAQRDASTIASDAQREALGAQRDRLAESIAAQEKMTDKAAAFLREQNQIARGDLAPFREAQLSALEQLKGLTDPNSEYYKAQRERSTQAIQQQLAAQGLLRSRNQSDLLTNLELGLNEQRQNILGNMANIGAVQGSANLSSGLGQTLAGLYGNLGGSLGSAFQQYGAAQAAGLANLGQIGAQGRMGVTNAILGGFQTGMNSLQGLGSNLMAQKQRADDRAWLSGLASQQQSASGGQVVSSGS